MAIYMLFLLGWERSLEYFQLRRNGDVMKMNEEELVPSWRQLYSHFYELEKTKNSMGIDNHSMNLKRVGLELCTCIWIEIMTCVGVTLYLLYLSQFSIAIITIAVFSPLIGFHFAISKLTKSDDLCASCQGVKILRLSRSPTSLN
jgi:hypothetical protein